MARWGMIIDLRRCIGCHACELACKQEKYLPSGVYWNRVLITEVGQYPEVKMNILPILCNHCEDPVCVKVCPTGATSKREDGIVVIDYDKCVGCRYCLISCPYQQRTYFDKSREGYYYSGDMSELDVLGEELHHLEKGTVTKCDFCVERIDAGMSAGLTPGIDPEATPACVNACPAKARYFGDLDDSNSEVSRLIREEGAVPLHPEFGTDPSVRYIPRT